MSNKGLIWANIIHSVQNSNIDLQKAVRLNQKHIKRNYRNELDMEMAYSQSLRHQEKKLKLLQRQLIDKEVQRQKNQNIRIGLNRQIKQREYRRYNQSLIERKYNQSFISKDKQYKEHPFISLVDKMEERKKNNNQIHRRLNFFNKNYSELKDKQKKYVSLKNIEEKKRYVQHVESMFKSRQEQRKKFEQKYLKINRKQRSYTELTSSQINLGKQYINFWEKQKIQHKTKKYNNERLDEQCSLINAQINKVDSSPAFLGRIVESQDRKRQKHIIEKNLEEARLNMKRKTEDIRIRKF